VVDVHTSAGGDEHSRDGDETGSDRPRVPAHNDRIGRLQREERRVLDHCLHAHAETRPAEEHVQRRSAHDPERNDDDLPYGGRSLPDAHDRCRRNGGIVSVAGPYAAVSRLCREHHQADRGDDPKHGGSFRQPKCEPLEDNSTPSPTPIRQRTAATGHGRPTVIAQAVKDVGDAAACAPIARLRCPTSCR